MTIHKTSLQSNPIELIDNKDYFKVALQLATRELSCKSSCGLPTDIITNCNEVVCSDGRPLPSGSDFQSSLNQYKCAYFVCRIGGSLCDMVNYVLEWSC